MDDEEPLAGARAALRTLLADLFTDSDTMPRTLEAYGGEQRALERFLLARGSDPEQAAAMFRETVDFRREHALDDAPRSPEIDLVLAKVRPHWPGSFGGHTCDGSPLQVFSVGRLDPGKLLEAVSEQELCTFYVWWMEAGLALQNETNKPGTPSREWKAMVEVYDMSGLSWSHCNVGALQMLSRVLSIGQAHYPENMRKCFIINVPFIFHAAWSVVSNVMNEVTLAKTEVRSDDAREVLLELLGSEERLDQLMDSANSQLSEAKDDPTAQGEHDSQ